VDLGIELDWPSRRSGPACHGAPPDGPTACVWELLAIDHERRAWVEYALSDPVDPDLGAYLAAGLVVYG
jgi:hypothetical protein